MTTIVFDSEFHKLWLTYNLSVEIKQVDVDATNSTILGTIYPDSDDQTTGKSVGFNQDNTVCLPTSCIYNSNNYK